MNIKYLLNKNSLFTGFILTIVVIILIRITPIYVDPVVKLVVSKNRVGISNIYQQRDIEFTKDVMVDRLNLFDNNRFSHPKLGNVASFADDFFIDINHQINVLEAGQFRFIVGSDDGFVLSIDGKKICEFAADRPYLTQPCFVELTKGPHQFSFSYFQGYGNSGLTVEYAYRDGKQYWFGDDSDSMEF
jgi:hypothetical protein